MALILGAISCTKVVEPEIVPPQSEGRVTLEVTSQSPLLQMDDADSGTIGFKSRGAQVVLDVVTSCESWDYTAKDASWLGIESDDFFLTITADKNEDTTARTATITITAGEGERAKSVQLTVSQNAMGTPEVSLGANTLHFEAHTALVQSVEVVSSYEEWEFETTCSWLFIERTEAGLLLTADSNDNRAQRQATITVTAGEDSDTLTVSQDGDAFVVLSSHNVATDSDGATKRVAVDCNPELQWGVTTDSSDWFTARAVDGYVEVTVLSNSNGGERRGTITVGVGDENNNASATICVYQIGTDTEALIYEIQTTTADYLYTAAPVLTSSTGGTITVDWGDGTPVETFEARRGTHTYAEPGLYTISITGSAKSLEFGAEDAFTTDLKSIISWGKLGYTTAVDMCLGCSELESIPNDVAGSFAAVKSFLGAFSCCQKLSEIPAGLFRYATVAKNFEDCFSHSASITQIPEGLFDACVAAEDFSYAFYGTGTGYVVTTDTLPNFDEVSDMVRAGTLRSVPESLFKNCKAAKQMDHIFGATALTAIPAALFEANTNVTTLMGAFSACVNLQQIPSSLLATARAVTDIKYMFAGCSSVTEIPSGLFTGCAALTNLEYIFYRTGVTRLQSGLFEGATGVKTFGAVFQGCESLKDIESGVFNGLDSATSFQYCFADCTALTTLPSGLFAQCPKAYNFTYTFENTALTALPADLFVGVRDYSSADLSYTFASCKSLKSVPSSLFETFTKITSPGFKYTFYDSGIESIPAGLFSKNTNVSAGFENTFNSCTALRTIEGAIFPQTTTVTSLAYTFASCTALESLPEGLFDNLGESKIKFTATFKGCTALKSLPEGLFAANSTATQFAETFSACSALESIPNNLLGAKEKLTTVKAMFEGCSSLKSIPADIFSLSPAITSFERTFASCSALTEIPQTLFAAIGTKTSSITLSSCFNGCTALTAIPAGLFDTITRINYISSCFENCSSLTGESPYTMIGEQKVHLYERTKGDDFPIIPSSTSAHADCFAGCKGLSDFSQMPSSWR